MADDRSRLRQPDSRATNIEHDEERDATVRDAIERRGNGREGNVSALEEEFARYCESRFGVGVSSGIEALYVALRACDVGSGDEVITVSQCPVSTVAAIELCGATPVFVDIEAQSFTLDPSQVKFAVTSRTKAVIPVHLFGHPADIEPILETSGHDGLCVIEDCSQSAGALYAGHRVGSFGDVGAFSFNAYEVLGASGNAGMVVTDDAELAERIRRFQGLVCQARGPSGTPRCGLSLDELQAAVLRVKLSHLDEENLRRRWLAGLYNSLLFETELALPRERNDVTHVYSRYVVRCSRRDSLSEFLSGKGLTGLNAGLLPVHLHPAYLGRVRRLEMGNTENASSQLLSLPLHPGMSDSEIGWVSTLVEDWARKETATVR